MPQDRTLDPFRRFYAEGGYVDAPAKKPSRLQEVEMALWGSQNFADGGAVEGYAEGGRFGLLRSYLGAYKDIFQRPITVAVPETVLPKVIADKRFKSQFETGRSEGSFDPTYRAQYEKDIFGHPLDLPNKQRTIYGHIADRDSVDSARSYGAWGAVLDPSVNKRSSFFMGDSLGARAPYGPYWKNKDPLEPENKNLFKQWVDELDKQRALAEAPFDPTVGKLLKHGDYRGFPGSYIEAQIHNGLPWSDVNALVHKMSGSWDDNLDRFIAKLTIGADTADRPAYGFYPKYDPDGTEYAKQWLRVRPNHAAEEIPESALSDIGYAEGGPVLPNLPSHGVPQAGPMHYGSDEEGFSEGGQFLRWVKNLAREGTTSEQSALKTVADYAKKTGNEALYVGEKFEPIDKGAWTTGDSKRVALPVSYEDRMREGTTPFTAHTHPAGSVGPSGADLRIWANHINALDNDPKGRLPRQTMWIQGIKGPNDTSVLHRAAADPMARTFEQMQPATEIDWKYMMGDTDKRHASLHAMKDFADQTMPETRFLPYEARKDAYATLDQGYLNNQLSKHLPLYFDPGAKIAPGLDYTTGDVWPEWLKYMGKRDIAPFSEGGQVFSPYENMGKPSDLELGYASQFYASGGRVK